MKKTALITAAVLFTLAFSAYAQIPEMPTLYTAELFDLGTGPSGGFLDSLNTNKDIYDNSPASKGGDGLLNAVSAWVDIPKGINEEARENNLFLGLTVGFGKGLVTGFAREIAGVADIATFGLPPYDKPLMKPEYTVSNPDRDGLKIAILSW
ncbi:MAG: exosortase system-associated protein, TIGR04073 family [Candidatus Omnitrophica bacterium]|nr:exosortase system-associated protein, TIGR04073 family [Candidatus Omnitrophota bacterium]